MTDIDCDYLPEPTRDDDGDLGKLASMVNTLGFHGVIMLAKPCPKCNRLHHWRMITTMPPGAGHVQQVLRYSALMMDAGTTESFVVLNPGGAQ